MAGGLGRCRGCASVILRYQAGRRFSSGGSVGASPGIELVLPTFHSLLTSTVNVLIAATELGCGRVVLPASLTEPTLGQGDSIPQSPYAAAKWAAGGYARMFCELYSTPAVSLRPFMAYGPAQARNKIIPSTILSLLRGERPRLSSGKTRADWVYIADVIDAFMVAATAPKIIGKTIDLGTGHLVPIRDVVKSDRADHGAREEPLFGALPDRPGENEIAANTKVAADLLGWTATTSLESGLRQTVDWFREELVTTPQ